MGAFTAVRANITSWTSAFVLFLLQNIPTRSINFSIPDFALQLFQIYKSKSGMECLGSKENDLSFSVVLVNYNFN